MNHKILCIVSTVIFFSLNFRLCVPVLGKDVINESLEKDTQWYCENLLRSSFLVRPQPEELDGRFFIITRNRYLNSNGYTRTRINLRQLKKIGITDIVQLTVRGNIVLHPTQVKNAIKAPVNHPHPDNYKSLEILVNAAQKEGLNVWPKIQFATALPFSEKVKPRNSKGKLYSRQCVDILSPLYKEFLYALIDEYILKYKNFKNFKGIMIDIPWSVESDYYGDDFDKFKKFCYTRFKEIPPQNIILSIDKERDWSEPRNKWWRRFILFRRQNMEHLIQELSAYMHKNNLKLIMHVDDFSCGSRKRDWSVPYNFPELSKYADIIWANPPQFSSETFYVMKKCAPAANWHKSWGGNFTKTFRGHKYAGLYYFFHALLMPTYDGCSIREAELLKRHITDCREWAGSESLTKIAILHNPDSMLMRLGYSKNQIRNHKKQLMDILSSRFDVDILYIGSDDLFKNYSLLIASEFSVRDISGNTKEKLREYVKNGGIILNLNQKWSETNFDFTKEKDFTSEFTGHPYERKIIPILQNTKKINLFDNVIGSGKVITPVNCDILSEMRCNNLEFQKKFISLIDKLADPPIKCRKHEKSPPVKIESTLKKNNWVAVALYSNDKTPARTTVFVDPVKLNLNSKAYRILLLGRNMELMKYIGGTGGRNVHSHFWLPQDLKKGINISILPDNELKLILPEQTGLKPKPNKNFHKRWKKNAVHRTFEYEILVIAPYNEFNIDGEKVD